MKSTLCAIFGMLAIVALSSAKSPETQVYENRLTKVSNPRPILADHTEFVGPIEEKGRYEAPILINDPDADLEVRAWRFSYNARGIIEVPNRLKAAHTAIVIVHPWGVDDGRGWKTPEPAGVAFACTPEKNALCIKHGEKVLNPFLKSMRDKVGIVSYSLPYKEDPVRRKLYRSVRNTPSADERKAGAVELEAVLKGFEYTGQSLPASLNLSSKAPITAEYFRTFPGLDSSDKFNHAGFWQLPIPVMRPIEVDPKDVVVYDGEGYEPFKKFLQERGIRHVLLGGYHTDMCVCETTAGYKNLSKDFNVFLVGDATIATNPAIASTNTTTTATIARASINLFITQVSWIK